MLQGPSTRHGSARFLLVFTLIALLVTQPKADHFIFGSGCFWGRQHDMVRLEQQKWARTPSEVTTVGGYFGGITSASEQQACYYNQHDINVYSEEGHGEVLRLDIDISNLKEDSSNLKDAFQTYFSSFVRASSTVYTREDYFDIGSGYRALIGFQGGYHNDTIMKILQQVDPHHTNFTEAKGDDADTLYNNQIWIYDTRNYTFHQAELCLQFHNNQTGRYSAAYHDLKQSLVKDGKLIATNCPLPEIDSCL